MDRRMLGGFAVAAAVLAASATAAGAARNGVGVTAMADETCRSTTPNGKGPGRVGASAIWARHGNGALSAVLRRDGTLVANPKGGYKMRWFAREQLTGPLTVRYQQLDQPSPLLLARAGTFSTGEYGKPLATMSQMSFSAGCWRITGRVRTVSISFVVAVTLAPAQQ